MTNKTLSQKLAVPYADAFFQVILNSCLKKNDISFLNNSIFEFQELQTLFSQCPELKLFLSSPINSTQAKKELLNNCLGQKIQPNLLSFLNLLIDKKRIQFFDSIAEKFLQTANEFLGVIIVEIRAAYELTTNEVQLIKEKLQLSVQPKLNSSYPDLPQVPIFQVKLIPDSTLLDGLIIKINSKVIDLSVHGELKQMAKKLNLPNFTPKTTKQTIENLPKNLVFLNNCFYREL